MIPCTGIKENTINNINNINNINIGTSSTCGSGKKYKQCHGKQLFKPITIRLENTKLQKVAIYCNFFVLDTVQIQ